MLLRKFNYSSLFFIVLSSALNAVTERRVVFDIGSGATRMSVADVDTQTGQITFLARDARKVCYKKDLEKQVNQKEFSEQVIQEGISAINHMKSQADLLLPTPTSYTGVATAAWRSIENGDQLLDRFERETGVRIKIIPQDEEARLGFQAALVAGGLAKDSGLVWDAGDGSMQLIASENDNLIMHGESIGFASFKKLIADSLNLNYNELADASKITLTRQQLNAIVELARKKVFASLNPAIAEKLVDQELNVLGIGGIHYHVSTAAETSLKNTYTCDELYELLDKHHKNQRPSMLNVALILGCMQALSVDQIAIVNADLTDGVLADKEMYFKKVGMNTYAHFAFIIAALLLIYLIGIFFRKRASAR